MKRICELKTLCTAWIVLFASHAYAQQYDVTSPNGLLSISLNVATTIEYEVSYDGTSLITPSAISVALNTGLVLGVNAVVTGIDSRSVNDVITPLYGKNATLTDHFNELKINFTQGYSLLVRAYDEGVAWRFVTTLPGDVIVDSETATFNFAGMPGVIFPEADVAMQSWERSYYTYSSISQIAANRFSVTPTMFSYPQEGIRVVVAESDLFDYPGMYLQRTATGMKGKWAQYPKTVSEPDNIYAYHRVLSRESYLAKTKGTREYPWRVVIVTADDKNLLNNELIYKLAKPSVLTNTSYIKPGKSAWEWWHDAILETTSIPSGVNNLNYNLYKYYVDFAAQYKLEYITMDAGWGMDYAAQLCQYAATKNVKVFVWDFINLPVENTGRLAQLKSLGVAGVKVDLIERDDQVAINWFQQLAQKCADLGLMITFHGCAKPTGLQRTYPNIVNFEAVRGAECNKWDDTPNPDYHLQFPFIRMLAGPLDYTPGSMRNVHRSQFSPTPTGVPKSMGTRAHEVAMYILFDQPLGYLCDSPTEYRKFSPVIEFISRIPTSWDQTLPLSAEVGKYAVVAKRKGDEWFVAAMTNGEARDMEVDFSFLPEGEFFAEVIRDNSSTDANAKVLTREIVAVTKQSKNTYSLSPGGGAAIYISDLVLGTAEETKKSFSVFQNATGTQLTIESDVRLETIHIVDLMGRILYTSNLSVNNTVSTVIDISALESGNAYIVYGTTRERFYSAKFAK